MAEYGTCSKSDIIEWSKNIAENYNKNIDTNILSQLIDAKNDCKLNMSEIDKRWQDLEFIGDKVSDYTIAYLLTGSSEGENEERVLLKGEVLQECWGREKPLEIKNKKYSVHRMSYGDWFLEPLGKERGETEGFASGTLWLEKIDPKKDIFTIE